MPRCEASRGEPGNRQLSWRPRITAVLAGLAVAVIARSLLVRLLLFKFRCDLAALNAGDHTPLLAAYSDDVILHFHDGDHRFAGDWIGKPGMDRFLQNLVRANITGEIDSIAVSGAPWAMTLWVRFNDHADAPDGRPLYDNRTVLVLRTRWGKVVEQDDFYADTARILAFERKLTDLGIFPIPKTV